MICTLFTKLPTQLNCTSDLTFKPLYTCIAFFVLQSIKVLEESNFIYIASFIVNLYENK